MNTPDYLARGYFPKELPPPFTTTSFARLVRSGGMPAAGTPYVAKMEFHSSARYGSLRRKFGIPNPKPFLALCQALDSNRDEIMRFLQGGSLSRSTPRLGTAGSRAVVPHVPIDQLVYQSATNRAIGRYLVKADIALFYHSIYTHVIPWALHGKAFAKAQRHDRNLLGNHLDIRVRDGQEGQTLGIPIGPDTSMVIAEIVLTPVDSQIASFLARSTFHGRGFRHSDEYEISVQSLADAERVFVYIQQALSEIGLSVNPNKSAIIELPVPLEQPWVRDLSSFYFRRNIRAQRKDLIHYFDFALRLAKDNPDSAVLKYAIARLRSIRRFRLNWPLLEALLLQCVSIDPSTLQGALYLVQGARDHGLPVNLELIAEMINTQITRNAPLGHSSEVAWALYSAIVFHLEISDSAASFIAEMNDSIVSILALDANEHGLLRRGLRTQRWQSYLSETELYGEQWLLSYVAGCGGFAALTTGRDYIGADPWFSHLRSNGVTFYDRTVAPRLPSPSRSQATVAQLGATGSY